MPEFYMILARKIIKIPEYIVMIFARKVYKIPEFYMIFARKMPKFYITTARKIFFSNFRGARTPCPPSPTPMQLREVTCHMGSHSVTCYRTQVNALRLNPSQ